MAHPTEGKSVTFAEPDKELKNNPLNSLRKHPLSINNKTEGKESSQALEPLKPLTAGAGNSRSTLKNPLFLSLLKLAEKETDNNGLQVVAEGEEEEAEQPKTETLPGRRPKREGSKPLAFSELPKEPLMRKADTIQQIQVENSANKVSSFGGRKQLSRTNTLENLNQSNFNVLGFCLNKLGKRASKRINLTMDREQLLQNQLVTTLNIVPRKRTKEQITLLEENAGSKLFFKKFLKQYGREGLRDLLKYCYYE